MPPGRAGDGAEDRPHERAVRVALDPWVEVVRDERELEAGGLGRAGLLDEGLGRVLLAG